MVLGVKIAPRWSNRITTKGNKEHPPQFGTSKVRTQLALVHMPGCLLSIHQPIFSVAMDNCLGVDMPLSCLPEPKATCGASEGLFPIRIRSGTPWQEQNLSVNLLRLG
jgi:hypothetical protein